MISIVQTGIRWILLFLQHFSTWLPVLLNLIYDFIDELGPFYFLPEQSVDGCHLQYPLMKDIQLSKIFQINC